jgi:peptide/nickel transport system permease protein
MIAAYARGWVDDVITRIMDAFVAFPTLIIAVGLVSAMGASLTNVIIAIALGNMPAIARVVRSQALSVRERDYCKAAQSTGASGWRIIFFHIWPNCTAPVIIQSTLAMAYAILIEAALGFLGVGVPPPTATWGSMLQFAFPLLTREPMLSIIPGIAIFLMVLSINFVGDALRDILDPKLRGVV